MAKTTSKPNGTGRSAQTRQTAVKPKWRDADFSIRDVQFHVDKLLPEEGFDVLEYIREGMGLGYTAAIEKLDNADQLTALVGAITLFPKATIRGFQEFTWPYITFKRQGMEEWEGKGSWGICRGPEWAGRKRRGPRRYPPKNPIPFPDRPLTWKQWSGVGIGPAFCLLFPGFAGP